MKHFDRVYCIHLPDPVRRRAIDAEFDKFGIMDVEYVHARPPREKFRISNQRRNPPIEFAVNLSHIKAVSHAIADGAECPLFVEDDIVFRDDSEAILDRAFNSMPKVWDLLYMGGHPCGEVEPLSDSLVSVQRFSFAESYSIRGPALQDFQDYWFDRIAQPDAMYDRILGEFARDRDAYCVFPVITSQPPVYSRISKRIDDKSELVRRGWTNNS